MQSTKLLDKTMTLEKARRTWTQWECRGILRITRQALTVEVSLLKSEHGASVAEFQEALQYLIQARQMGCRPGVSVSLEQLQTVQTLLQARQQQK